MAQTFDVKSSLLILANFETYLIRRQEITYSLVINLAYRHEYGSLLLHLSDISLAFKALLLDIFLNLVFFTVLILVLPVIKSGAINLFKHLDYGPLSNPCSTAVQKPLVLVLTIHGKGLARSSLPIGKYCCIYTFLCDHFY